MSAWPSVLALLVAAALVLAGPPRDRRLGAAQVPRTGPAGPGAVRVRWRTSTRRAGGPLAEAAAVARVAGELAALLRAGVGAAPAWAHAAGAPAAGAGGEAGGGPGATQGSGAVDRAVAAAAGAASRGQDVALALRAGAARAGPAGEALLALSAAWQVAERTGAPAADVLDHLAASLLADRAQALARAAALAGPRSSARVLAVLPVAGLALGALVGVDALAVLAGTAAGRVSAAVGVACAVGGWWWTRLLVRAAERAA